MKTYKLIINNEKYEAKILEYSGSHAKISVNGNDYIIQIEDDAHSTIPKLTRPEKASAMAPNFTKGTDANSGEVRSPLPGVIVTISVKEGDIVKKGQQIISLEAMKMESEIAAPTDGKISKIHVREKNPVQEGDLLITIECDEVCVTTPTPKSSRQTPKPPSAQVTQSIDNIVRAPLPGVVLDLKVGIGDVIGKDDVVLILEAMKMESEISSSLSGKVVKLFVQKGASVQDGDPLIELEV
ncbi:MAG: acetyl-CoA carboxylase biotin carboxyl carrier protein subunit [Candidatus Cloacimonetes bacterium HGW-Cloacimonetes-1]|jgi:pyruvate dehydrogenase E2 component (dihydrolipoamide acetyltransferase)|nr:MAG: acetyl-CoA carboxylase biotin carboxyl carrier protein subunit [Candidatus Cloacimonetes bacterium HGW-Cloacimonetes-1]